MRGRGSPGAGDPSIDASIPRDDARSRQRISRSPGAVRPQGVSHAKRELAAAIERAARSAGVDPALGVAVARAESSLDPSAVAFDGLSRGTFQVLPSTQREVRARIRNGDIPRPAGNDDVALGVGYLRHLDDLLREGGELPGGREVDSVAVTAERRRFVAAAYNAGPGRVAWAQEQAREHGLDPRRFSSIERWLPGITRRYVPRVVGFHGEEMRRPTAVEA